MKALHHNRKESNSKCHILISYVATPYTINEAEILRDEISEEYDEFFVYYANNQAGTGGETGKGITSIIDEYAPIWPCTQLFNNINITPEGYLSICGNDFNNYGLIANINDRPLIDAWNSDEFVKFRRGHLSKEGIKKGSMCYNCFNRVCEEVYPLIDHGYIIKNDKSLELDVCKRIELLKSQNKG